MSLRAKFLCGTLLVIALVMGTVMIVVERQQHADIVDEVERLGEVLARSLAATSHAPLLLYNFTALEQNVARIAAEADVVYALVIDADGQVAAHSRHPEYVGLRLPGDADRRAGEATALLTQETFTRHGEAIYDVAVPIIVDDHKWGTVRVGVSKQRMEADIRRTRWQLGLLALLTLVLGGVAADVVARRIARPVRQLAAGAAAISRGDIPPRIEPTTQDEIGALAAAFNHMASELLQQRTALERANAELRARFEEVADLKSYTDNVLASLTNGIVTVDLDGRIVTVNAAAELMTGYFTGEVRGRYCTEIFSGTPELGEILMETLATRMAAPGTALTLRRRDGRTLPVEFSAAPLRGGESKDLGVIGVFRDLTVVRNLERRLQRSDRLAAVGELAAGIAHEIKNPLTSLLTFSRRLTRRFDDAQFREKFQAVVPRELERINSIVEGLLELSRPSRLEFQPVRVPALLERALELHGHDVEAKSIEVLREYARDLPAIWGDADALYRALLNLVANALEAMDAGGRLTLRVRWALPGEATPAVKRGHRLLIEVEDTGHGIPEVSQHRVFNPFFTSKDAGTGLGLALTHKIVEDHGGTIDFRTREGSGTTFRIVLPMAPDVADGSGPHAERR